MAESNGVSGDGANGTAPPTAVNWEELKANLASSSTKLRTLAVKELEEHVKDAGKLATASPQSNLVSCVI
jgi:hypothetical protein